MAGEYYLLDTNVLIALLNGKALGMHIAATYNLTTKLSNACVCIVSHGEIWALARVNDFDKARCDAIANMLDRVVTIGLGDALVVESSPFKVIRCQATDLRFSRDLLTAAPQKGLEPRPSGSGPEPRA